MRLKDLKIGLGITGSFCNFPRVLPLINDLKKEGVSKIIPIISYSVKSEYTRFYDTTDFLDMLRDETGESIIDTVTKAEPIGPKSLIDILVICPCTGNTVAKLANGITDTPVLMAAKSHLRNNKPVVIGVSTNDGLGKNARNIGELLDTKNVFFVPYGQDDYTKKPKSLVLDYLKVIDTIIFAKDNKQIQPLFIFNK